VRPLAKEFNSACRNRGNDAQRSELAAVLGFYNVQPGPKPNKIADDEVKNKCLIEIRLPILADSITNADCCSVRQHSSKPNVASSFCQATPLTPMS
jgi:hypothetical protein